MNIPEMHVWFRQYAQQMGMQNVRAILPEQIDLLINTASLDIVSEIVDKSIGTTNDRVITDNSKIASINALRTLYKVHTITPIVEYNVSHYSRRPFTFYSESIPDEILYYVDFSLNYVDTSTNYNLTGAITDVGTYIQKTLQVLKLLVALENDNTTNLSVAFRGELISILTASKQINNAAYHVVSHTTALDSAVTYIDDAGDSTLTGATLIQHNLPLISVLNNIVSKVCKDSTTKLFPIRIIDDAYLADVLNDWVLAPRLRTPAMVIYKEDANQYGIDPFAGQNHFDLYVGENDFESLSSITSKLRICQIRCSYIKKPREVHYLADVNGDNVNSDLPEQLQIPMLKHAVDLYRASIQGSLFVNQENAKAQQQEAYRNNVRPDNEGYQS